MYQAKVSTRAFGYEYRAAGHMIAVLILLIDPILRLSEHPPISSKWKRPVVPSDLMRHQCIRARMGIRCSTCWEFEKHAQAMLIDAPGSLTLDESGLMLEAAVAGAGLCLYRRVTGCGAHRRETT